MRVYRYRKPDVLVSWPPDKVVWDHILHGHRRRIREGPGPDETREASVASCLVPTESRDGAGRGSPAMRGGKFDAVPVVGSLEQHREAQAMNVSQDVA